MNFLSIELQISNIIMNRRDLTSVLEIHLQIRWQGYLSVFATEARQFWKSMPDLDDKHAFYLSFKDSFLIDCFS